VGGVWFEDTDYNQQTVFIKNAHTPKPSPAFPLKGKTC